MTARSFTEAILWVLAGNTRSIELTAGFRMEHAEAKRSGE
jgi:hypothetical protein